MNMPYNPRLIEQIYSLKKLGIQEIHLTGGEPTLHPELPEITKSLVDNGFIVKMTTNGQGSSEMMRRLTASGICSIAFSMISLDPVQFLSTQRIKSIPWARAMIDREVDNILLAKDLGVEVKINTVVLGKHDYPRVNAIREFAQKNGIKLVLLNSLGDGETAQQAVFDYVESYGQYFGSTEFTNNGKGSKHYLLKDSVGLLDAKYIRPFHPEIVCQGCEHNGLASCVEKFYGVRMEFRGGEPYIRLCIQKTNERTVMPLAQFLERDIYSKL